MSRYRIIYTDDEADIREIAALALEMDPDFEVMTCDGGEPALELAARWHPHLILLDYMMPGLDGPATLERLRRTPAGAQTQVAFVTARVQSQDVARLFALGATGVVPKPFDPMTLAATVKKFLPS